MQINLDFKKALSLFNLGVVHAFLFSLLGAVLALLLSRTIGNKSQQIATVDITKIINQFTRAEAKKELSTEGIKKEVNEFSRQLEQTLHDIAKHNHLILVPKEAVIAGSNDYTKIIIQKMMRR